MSAEEVLIPEVYAIGRRLKHGKFVSILFT